MNDDEMKGEAKENDSKSKAYEAAKASEPTVCPCWQHRSENIKHRKSRHILRLL